jgi:NAD+ synthase (glutamine-hydrolysing)
MPADPPPFRSLYAHGFLRAAVATPLVSLASPRDNAAATIALAKEAAADGAALVVFPELGPLGYAIEDLHFQDALLAAVQDAVAAILDASRSIAPAIVVGAPLHGRPTGRR